MRQIAFYGKGGIGKSNITSNISASLVDRGYRVLQVGCDPKHDSTVNLCGGRFLPTILDAIRENEETNKETVIDDIIFEGYKGVFCAEAGGPLPGVGCGGKGVIVALELLESLNVYDKLNLDFVLYDVLGDVVCGGFSMPIRMGYAQEVYIVTSGELMPLYAANNISFAIERFSKRGDVRLGGLICNCRNVEREHEKVSNLADRIGSQVMSFVPKNEIVRDCEVKGQTVVEGCPDSEHSKVYHQLSEKIVNNQHLVIPNPVEKLDELSIL